MVFSLCQYGLPLQSPSSLRVKVQFSSMTLSRRYTRNGANTNSWVIFFICTLTARMVNPNLFLFILFWEKFQLSPPVMLHNFSFQNFVKHHISVTFSLEQFLIRREPCLMLKSVRHQRAVLNSTFCLFCSLNQPKAGCNLCSLNQSYNELYSFSQLFQSKK